jgi:type I restriction enzyme S subunit
MNLKIDKSSWKKVKLGDVAFEYTKRINDPSKSGLERFVGSSNIGQWDFRVRSWDSTDSVTSAMKIFEENDYLLVRRSLYASDFRERAPRANFKGVCSGDILTIKENSKVIADGFLIGILNSPDLWKYVVAKGSGSITRRIKWRDLANYDFLLPPKDQQARLAELLWSGNEFIETLTKVSFANQKLKTALQRQYFENYSADKKLQSISLSKIGKIYSGGTPNRKIKEYWNGLIPWVRTAEVNYNVINNTEEFITEEGLKNSATKLVKVNSILIAMYGEGVTRGRVALTGIPLTTNQACAVVEVEEIFKPEFLYYFLEYKYENLRALAHGANQQNLNLKMIKDFTVPLFPLEIQEKVVKEIVLVDEANRNRRHLFHESISLQKALINQIF